MKFALHLLLRITKYQMVKTCALAFVFSLTLFFAMCQSKENWYKVYTGNIGNLSATFHLIKSNNSYSGYIWCNQNQWPMPVYGSEKKYETDSIIISSGSGLITMTLTGVLNNDSFSGTSFLEKTGSDPKKSMFHLSINNDKKFTPFEYLLASDSAKLLPEIENESVFSSTMGTIWPVTNTGFDATLKAKIKQVLRMPSTVNDAKKWFETKIEKLAATWKKQNNKITPKKASEMGLSLSEDEETSVGVMYENEYYITLADYNYSFTGGAHGNYGTTLVTINKKNNRLMQLTDILNTQGISRISAYLDKAARLQFDVNNNKPLDQNNFFVKKITPSKNLYITTTGIGFLYSPYELRSFADGEVNLFVPFTTLASYLQSSFKH
jgi:putative sterol carrier protein